jgi:hypothetical protein
VHYATSVMRRWLAVLFAAQVLWPVVAGAQAPAPAAPAPAPAAAVTVVPNVGVPGNPTNPADTINNPHPTMPWVGITIPSGQFLRWVWMPPQPVVANDQVLYQPGFWVAETTAGYYYPARWVLRESSPGTFGWVLENGGAVPFAR